MGGGGGGGVSGPGRMWSGLRRNSEVIRVREPGNVKPVSAAVALGHPWVHGMKVLLGGDLLQESDCLSYCNRIESSLCIPPSLSPGR